MTQRKYLQIIIERKSRKNNEQNYHFVELGVLFYHFNSNVKVITHRAKIWPYAVGRLKEGGFNRITTKSILAFSPEKKLM